MKRIFLVVFATINLLTAAAQTPAKTTTTSTQIWTQYFLSARLNTHWGAYFDGGIRFAEFFQGTTQLMLRPGVIYYAHPNVTLSTGVVYFRHYPAFTGNQEVRPEWRPWQQVNINGKLGKAMLNHRYRFEQRWQTKMSGGYQTDDWNFNFRMRYQLSLTYPLKGDQVVKGVPYLQVYDEFMFNFGKEIVYNTFDQNRIYVGMGYAITDQLSVNAGYQWIYSQERSGYQYESVSFARFTLMHQLDFRKKAEVNN